MLNQLLLIFLTILLLVLLLIRRIIKLTLSFQNFLTLNSHLLHFSYKLRILNPNWKRRSITIESEELNLCSHDDSYWISACCEQWSSKKKRMSKMNNIYLSSLNTRCSKQQNLSLRVWVRWSVRNKRTSIKLTIKNRNFRIVVS